MDNEDQGGREMRHPWRKTANGTADEQYKGRPDSGPPLVGKDVAKMLWCGCPVQAIESTKIEKEKGILRGVHILRQDSLLSVDSKSTPVFIVKNHHTRHE